MSPFVFIDLNKFRPKWAVTIKGDAEGVFRIVPVANAAASVSTQKVIDETHRAQEPKLEVVHVEARLERAKVRARVECHAVLSHAR